MFSVPFNPKLTEKEFNQFGAFLLKNKKVIYDVYFTSRMPPFSQDAMGDMFKDYQWSALTENALIIQNNFGIPISATFNNIHVSPTDKNLDLFIKNFKILYDQGVRSATIPHTLWLLTGKIQKEFPELLIKNTILRNAQRANEVVKLAEAGFHYVNLDRDLMRDEDSLLEIKRAKEYCKDKLGVDIKISLLINEGCSGNCPVQDEHFSYNLMRDDMNAPTYFMTNISKFSCPKWESEDFAYNFRVANLPPWKKDWDYFLENLGIDVFKTHGRESVPRLFETMRIIDRYANNENIMWQEFDSIADKADPNLLEAWRTTIRNCKFNCWDCNVCDKVALKNTKTALVSRVENALNKSLTGDSKLTDHTKNIKGLTSVKVKNFLNILCEMEECRYLEIGAYQGATFSAALDGNNITAFAIDNFSGEGTHPMRKIEDWGEDDYDVKTQFFENIRKVSSQSTIKVFDEDIQAFDVGKIDRTINILFYDGGHSEKEHYNVINKFLPILNNIFILIIDDWNWIQVKEGTTKGISDNNLQVLLKKEIITSGEDFNDYWNGLGIFVLRQAT